MVLYAGYATRKLAAPAAGAMNASLALETSVPRVVVRYERNRRRFLEMLDSALRLCRSHQLAYIGRGEEIGWVLGLRE